MKNPLRFIGIILLSTGSFFLSCSKIDVFEKSVSIPGHAWDAAYKPEFRFTITDTTVPYNIFVILRHTDQYNYTNIYVNLDTKQPGADSAQIARYDLRLSNEKGWLGTGMDDIYEHRIALTPLSGEFYFKKPGEYIFTIEQIMRDNPLKHVMNVGLRVEKKH